MASEHARILIVNASQTNGDGLARQLEQQDYRVACSVDVGQASAMIAAQPFDLVLLDIRGPKVDGSSLLEQLKSGDPVRHIPVVALARADNLAGVEWFLAIGGQDYLREPFSPVLLKARIDSCLEKKRLLDQEYAQKDFLKYERELEIGRQIQTSFLPDTLLQPPGWEIAAYFQPARQVAGDFYDAFPLPHNRIGLVIADVCDKGVSAALFMALARSLIRAFAQQHYALSLLDALSSDRPAATKGSGTGRRRALPSIGTQALKNAVVLTNNYIAVTHAATNMFATMFFGVLDPATGTLIYINGGHEPPAICGPAGIKARLKPTGPAVGMMPDMDFEIQQAQLDPGDMLVAYTDGVTEAHSLDGKLLTERRLLAMLEQPAASAADLLDRIVAGVRAHMAGADPFDDITILAVRRADGVEG